MVRKVRVGYYGRNVAETMFAWNSENITESIGYEVEIKERTHIKIPKTTGCGPLSWQMNQENKNNPEQRDK